VLSQGGDAGDSIPTCLFKSRGRRWPVLVLESKFKNMERYRSLSSTVALAMLQVGVFCALLGKADAQNLINVKLAGGTPGLPTGAAAIGTAGDVWNYFPSLSGRASGGGVVTNAATIKDSAGATLGGVALSVSLSGGDGMDSFSDTASFSPTPSLIMGNYVYESSGINYWTISFTGLTTNKPYMLYGMGNGNASGQGTTWWVDVANGHATASATANFASGNRDATLAGNQGICWVKLPATATAAGALTFRVVQLNAGEGGTGGSGRAYLNAFQLQPLSVPAITNLTNQTVIAGTAATLSPAISGVPTPTYQWRSNSVPIVGATNASFVLNNVQYAQNGTAYSLVASNLVGVVSNSMTLTVIVTPLISGLNNQAVPIGSTVTLAPTVSGVPTPATRWLANGNPVADGASGNGSTFSGSATATLVLNNAQAADSGTYALVATNSAGSVTNSMTLTVSSGNVPPNITGPSDQTAVQTSNATFTASVSGLPVPALQWRVNGTVIPGATDPTLTITNVQYAQNGQVYSLVASNLSGLATNSASLFVLVPPAISQPPTNLSVVVGSTAVFSVGAGGVPAVKYQWSRNAIPIANATNNSYTITNAQGVDNGAIFSVTVSNSVGNVTSSDAVLTVLSTMTGVLLPTNGATSIAPDQQLRILFSSPPKIGSGKLSVRDAADNSLLATIDVGQFQTFTLFAATITNAAVRTVQGSAFFYQPIAIYGNEAWITLNPTNRPAYNRAYYVNADAGLFQDSANAAFPAISGTNTWRFSTKSAGPATPTASTGPTNLTVALDGAGDFATLQGASDWIPQNNTLKRTITVQPGTYRDFTLFAQNRNNVTVIGGGLNRQDVQLIYLYPAYANATGAGTLRLESSDIYVRNLTLDNRVYLTNNGVVFAGPIQSLMTTGSRLIFDNVLIKGGQDTLYTISGITYFNRCEIWGSVDFIYGAALSVFDQCDIFEIRNTGGPIGAPNTTLASPYGLTFLNCNFPRALIANGYPYDVNTGSTTMMRPWYPDGYMAVINCAVGSQFSTKGWSEWDGRENTCRARESGTTLIGGGAVTPAQRQAAGAYWLNTIDPDYVNDPSLNPTNTLVCGPSGTNNRVAVTINTNDFTLSAIFGHPYYNLGGWLPTVMPTITSQPTNLAVNLGGAASFGVAAIGLPSPVFQWLKNGTNVSGATNATFTVTNAQAGDIGVYSVLVSNSAGTISSSNALLNVTGSAAPVITTQPTNQAAITGGTVTFTIAATGLPAPVFQWFKNGATLPAATNFTLIFTNVQVADIGTYSVVASNSIGSITSSNATFDIIGPNGFSMVSGATTGGTGGTVVTVTNGSDFNTQINIAGPRVIQVQGVLSIGRVFTTANKTIVGLGTNATLLGNLNVSDTTNVILQNLRVTGPANDGFTIWNAQHVWIDHCTFYDTGDGLCDMSRGSQYVTVSWCKFHYLNQIEHRFTMIADGYLNLGVTNLGYYTLHHNWWSTGCDQRMAASSYGRVHYYDNYFTCTNNFYSSNARNGTEIKSENNYYAGVNNPVGVSSGTDGKIQTSGNIYSGCTGTIHLGTDAVFTPPYGYLLDTAANVPALVMAGAGAAGPDSLAIPPKIWDGGGTGNNWSTANNWGLNETPKVDNVLIFAGTTRLAPNNDLATDTEYSGILFSNTAGAFVVGGNAFNLGGPLTDDSTAVQTINANMDFAFGQFHYATNRYVNVSATGGSLVLNGNIAGDTNAYFNSYSLTKQGAGLLSLNGTNTFIASLQLNGGLIQFNTLDTNQPGSLGSGSAVNFNGGGLRWAAGNNADISLRTLTIQSGGATLDSGANSIVLGAAIGNSGSGALTKVGVGKITLNGSSTYSGPTFISQGALALGSAGSLASSSQIVLSNNATLDVSGRTDGTLTLGGGKSLVGSGSVLGSVNAASGSTVAPGSSIGTLIITNFLTFQAGSTNIMQLNASSHTNDLIAGMLSVNYGGRLVVTNLAGTLAAGDSFKLFSAGSYGGAFGSIALPPLTGNLMWTNRLATDGALAVVLPVNTTPTNILLQIAGSQLQLSWPAGHIGWRLEAQTNASGTGLGTNWVSLGYDTTNLASFPIAAGNGTVFYRLAYP